MAQNMQNFIKMQMTLVNYGDAEKLKTKEKSEELTSRERYHAEALKELPSFLDWCHYFMMINTATCGAPIEYRPSMEWLNHTGDIAKMTPFSNFLPALRRYGEVLLCMACFLVIQGYFDMTYLVDPAFAAEPVWVKSIYLCACMHMKMYMMFVGFCC